MRFDDDAGWVVLHDLFSSTEVEAVLAVCHELLATPPERRARGDKPRSGTRHLMELDERSSAIDAMVVRLEGTGLITEILGPDHRRDQVSLRSPQPGFGGQRLHADDVAQSPGEPARAATAIVALTDFTTRNGATRIVPGSHNRPDLQRESGRLEHHVDERLVLPAAGSTVLFTGHLLHSGTTNHSEQERPALQIVWRR